MKRKVKTAAASTGTPVIFGDRTPCRVSASLPLTSNTGWRAKIYLHPGQCFASTEPSAVTTILGSCVSLCVWDCMLKIGGMNHYLLPFSVSGEVASPRIGAVAIEMLIKRVIFMGAAQNRLQAKLVGGACVIEAFREKEDHIGRVNAQIAEIILRTLGIPVVEQDLGGRRGRKLTFNTDNGESSIRYL